MRKAIFITGGGSGIGRAVAQLFAARGWFVGLADISETGMADTAALLPRGQSHSQRLDVRERDAWDAALAGFAEAAGGRIDVVVNNAGVGVGGLLDELCQDEIDALIDINFRGMVYGAQAAYPYLKASAPGSALVNTSSAAGIYGIGGLALYSATKFAVRGLTEALDIEWSTDRIKVRSLMPGSVDTPILDGPNNRNSNLSRRESTIRAGFEFVPVEAVAEAAWRAVHAGKGVHHRVGSSAQQLAFGARWAPGALRRRLVKLLEATGVRRNREPPSARS